MSKTFQKNVGLILLLCTVLNVNFAHDSKCVIENESAISILNSGEYLAVIDDLIDHVNGIIELSDSDFEQNHVVLLQNLEVLSTDENALVRSFELLALFEEKEGALFTTNATRNGFNRAYATDGLNLHRNIILIHQGIIDFGYTTAILSGNPGLIDGKYYQSSQYFPGAVAAPENPDAVEVATVKCSYMLAKGSQPWSEIGNSNVVRPTGCYLAPGSIGEITVPEELVNQGIKIRVGAHFWNLENKSRYKRMDRVSILYDVENVTTKIANPLGGGIYIEIPLGVDLGLVDVELKNVVRSPFFSMKTFHETTLDEWQNTERLRSAPWTDFETDKFMMQVPTSWIYAFDDPKSLLEDWDKSMDAVSDLLGRPRITDRHKNYLQFDVIIRGGAYHPGYPMSNTPYDPNATTDGTPDHNIMRGPQFNQDIHFHELGHEVAITKFVGETEAIVNFLYVPVLNKCFGYSLAEAFQKSFGPSYNYTSTKDNTTRTRLVADTFHEGLERNTCSCTKNEVRYQHRGYAHYVDIVELFGWEALEAFWQSEGEAADMGMPFPVNNQPQDDRIFRMSKAAGVDLRPLFHFWGIHPDQPDELAQRMLDNDLKLPLSIKGKLHKYRDLIPANYDEFIAFGNELYPDFLNYGGTQFDFGAGWYKVTAETYDESKAEAIENALSEIIILYYGSDCFYLEELEIPEIVVAKNYCKKDETIVLPTTTYDGVMGSWSTPEFNTLETGVFEYVFTPDLDQCALETSIVVEVYGYSTVIEGEAEFCYGDSTTLFIGPMFPSYQWELNGEIVGDTDSVIISEGGMLNFVAVEETGCLVEARLEVVENETIDIAINVMHPICNGEAGNVQFVPLGSTGSEYEYSIDDESLSAGVYSVIVTDSSGCSESFGFEVVEPDPIHIELVEDVFIVSGGVEPYNIIFDTLNEIQLVTVYDGNGCAAEAEFIITHVVDVTEADLSILPNPAFHILHLNLDEIKKAISGIKMVSSDGQLIQRYAKNSTSMDVSAISNGVYFLQLEFEDGTGVSKKVIILK
ncbi:MAG: M60 family metallopeptidase [Saprospiraceae bacterium]|nr:M60 family metallopeptidase [Saprospiraceae bacterium]